MQNVTRVPARISSIVMSAFMLAGMAIALSACNTTAGVGQDVSATGHALTNSAEKVKQGL